MDINVRQIRSFIAVAKASSFTQAANTLNMSQPALTVQIRKLEDQLGLRLLDRNPRVVELTRVGRELLPVLERTVRDLDNVLAGAKDLSDERRGIVRVATLPSFAAGPLPDAILAFRKTHKAVSFQINDVVAGKALAQVRSEDVDLAILGGDMKASDVEVIASSPERLVVVYPPGHPIDDTPQITAECLAAYPLVVMHPETSVRVVTDTAFKHHNLSFEIAAEATYMMTAVAMVRAGLGLAVLPETAREVQISSDVRARVIDDELFVRPIFFVKKAGRTLPPASEAFSRHLATIFKKGHLKI